MWESGCCNEKGHAILGRKKCSSSRVSATGQKFHCMVSTRQNALHRYISVTVLTSNYNFLTSNQPAFLGLKLFCIQCCQQPRWSKHLPWGETVQFSFSGEQDHQPSHNWFHLYLTGEWTNTRGTRGQKRDDDVMQEVIRAIKEVKVKLSLCLTKHHAKKTYWGAEV
jgi:hypothetical protein